MKREHPGGESAISEKIWEIVTWALKCWREGRDCGVMPPPRGSWGGCCGRLVLDSVLSETIPFAGPPHVEKTPD